MEATIRDVNKRLNLKENILELGNISLVTQHREQSVLQIRRLRRYFPRINLRVVKRCAVVINAVYLSLLLLLYPDSCKLSYYQVIFLSSGGLHRLDASFKAVNDKL